MVKIKIKPISIGVLVGILGTLVTAVLVYLISMPFLFQKIPFNSSIDVVTKSLQKNLVFMILALFIPLFWSFIGGLIAGYLAKANELLNSICMGIIFLILNAVLYALWPSTNPLWIDLLFFILIMPAVIFGGFISQRNSEKTAVIYL